MTPPSIHNFAIAMLVVFVACTLPGATMAQSSDTDLTKKCMDYSTRVDFPRSSLSWWHNIAGPLLGMWGGDSKANAPNVPTLTLEIEDNELQQCFDRQARQIQSLLIEVHHQKKVYDKFWKDDWRFLQVLQITIISLGALASVLIAFGGNERLKMFRLWAVIPTSLVTVFTAVDAFYDSRGSLVRDAATRFELATLESDIQEKVLYKLANAQTFPTKFTDQEMNGWNDQLNNILKNAGDKYVSSF